MHIFDWSYLCKGRCVKYSFFRVGVIFHLHLFYGSFYFLKNSSFSRHMLFWLLKTLFWICCILFLCVFILLLVKSFTFFLRTNQFKFVCVNVKGHGGIVFLYFLGIFGKCVVWFYLRLCILYVFFFVSSLRRLLEWVFLMFIIIALEGCFYWRGCELGCVYRIHLKMFWVSFFLRRALVIDFCVPKRIVWFLNVWVVYVFLNVVVLIIFGRIIDDWFWRFEGDGLESYC